MKNTMRFNGKGNIYAKARPKYAGELMDYLKDGLRVPEKSIFADIGSGTGIFTQQLLECGYTVYAVEPNADMRQKAEEKLSGRSAFHSVTGTAENTNLTSHSVDYVTAAQAFHWFDAQAFRRECRRILKPGGKVLLVYNSRDKNAECTKALAKLRYRFHPEFHGFSNGISDEACRDFFANECAVTKWDNNLSYDREGYVNRVLSSSYSLQEEDPRFAEYLAEIHRLFDRFAVNEILTVPTDTVVYVGCVEESK